MVNQLVEDAAFAFLSMLFVAICASVTTRVRPLLFMILPSLNLTFPERSEALRTCLPEPLRDQTFNAL